MVVRSYSEDQVIRKPLPLLGWALLALSLAQVVTSQVPEWFGVGRNIGEQSDVTAHPLVPLGPAFAIWGVIYLYGIVSAVWALRHSGSPALREAGWHLAGVWLCNAAWAAWVPVNGIEWVSFVIIALAVTAGLTGLKKLRRLGLSRSERYFVFAPLALATGWITAAMFVNFTSALVGTGADIDPRQVMVSVGFLLALIAFGGLMVRSLRSVTYAGALIWALAWILVANVTRQDEPLMAFTAVIGIGLLLVLVFTVRRRTALV